MKLPRTLTAGLLALAVNSAFAAGSPGVEHTPKASFRLWLQAAASRLRPCRRKTPGQC